MKRAPAIFGAAAIFNLVVGGALVFAPTLFGQALGMAFDTNGQTALRIAGLLIACFGIGYAMVAANPVANRDLVRLGIIGKTSFVCFVAISCATGALPMRAALPASGDLIFASLFVAVLRSFPRV